MPIQIPTTYPDMDVPANLADFMERAGAALAAGTITQAQYATFTNDFIRFMQIVAVLIACMARHRYFAHTQVFRDGITLFQQPGYLHSEEWVANRAPFLAARASAIENSARIGFGPFTPPLPPLVMPAPSPPLPAPPTPRAPFRFVTGTLSGSIVGHITGAGDCFQVSYDDWTGFFLVTAVGQVGPEQTIEGDLEGPLMEHVACNWGLFATLGPWNGVLTVATVN